MEPDAAVHRSTRRQTFTQATSTATIAARTSTLTTIPIGRLYTEVPTSSLQVVLFPAAGKIAELGHAIYGTALRFLQEGW
jgi:hypothetical protein